jgi:hypothetical protein
MSESTFVKLRELNRCFVKDLHSVLLIEIVKLTLDRYIYLYLIIVCCIV